MQIEHNLPDDVQDVIRSAVRLVAELKKTNASIPLSVASELQRLENNLSWIVADLYNELDCS